MLRHPHYLELPWDIHGHRATTESHRHLWWVIAVLVLLAMFLIGVVWDELVTKEKNRWLYYYLEETVKSSI